MKEPKTTAARRPLIKKCNFCGIDRNGEEFIETRSPFFHDHCAPMCNSCIKENLIANDFNWHQVDKYCQLLDIPFVPNEFHSLFQINGENTFPIYATKLQESEYEGLDWGAYYRKYKELMDLQLLEDELPIIHEQRVRELSTFWGENYDEEELHYLEDLYNGMLATQTVSGMLQVDQARKLCKISLEIDKRIRANLDFDKLMASYDKMIKTAEFTPKNAKSENDFDSFGEVFAWLERRGWINQYFDDVSRDIVDEVIQNTQAFNQRLYINESGIGESITTRIEALKTANALERDEDHFNINEEFDLDNYDNDGYTDLIKEELSFDEEDDAGMSI